MIFRAKHMIAATLVLVALLPLLAGCGNNQNVPPQDVAQSGKAKRQSKQGTSQ